MSTSAENDFNACDDFFVVVVKCRIIAATMQYFKMTGVDDKPDHPLLKDDLWVETLEKQRDVLQSVANSWFYYMEPILLVNSMLVMILTVIMVKWKNLIRYNAMPLNYSIWATVLQVF